MIEYDRKTISDKNGSGRGVVLVEGSSRNCPLTLNLTRIRHDPTVQYFRNHLWAREEGDKVTIGINDLALKLLQPIMAWVASSSGNTVKPAEHLFWVKSLGGLISFNSQFHGTIERFNEQLYNDPHLPCRSPYHRGWVFTFLKSTEHGQANLKPVPSLKSGQWLREEALRWERMLMEAAGLDNQPPGAMADGGTIITDPWVALGPAGMQKLFSDFFADL